MLKLTPSLLVLAFTMQQTQPPPPTQAPAPTRGALQLRVSDGTGAPLASVRITATGPTPRDGVTGTDGSLRLTSLRPGLYRLRFDSAEFVPLERELTVRAGAPAQVDVVLTKVPPKEAPPPAAPCPPSAPPPPSEPPGEPQLLELTEFIQKNYIGRAPMKESILSHTPNVSAVLLQLNAPLEEHQHADADELIYFIAGEATIRMAGQERVVGAKQEAWFATIPRGTPHSITRRGRNPVVALSMMVRAKGGAK